MNYPDIDQTLGETARQKYASAIEAVEATQAAVTVSEGALATALAGRKTLIEKAASGEPVTAADHAEIEQTIRDREAEILRLKEILAIQETAQTVAMHDIRKANGLAHRQRILHAIRELRDAGIETDAATRALRAADRRAHEAKEVLRQAWGAGHPLPPAFMPVNGNIYQGEKLMAELAESQIRRNFGPYAEEALGTPAVGAA